MGVVQNIAHAAAANLTVLLDTYRNVQWRGAANEGGDAQGATNTFISDTSYHKITMPVVQRLVGKVMNNSNYSKS